MKNTLKQLTIASLVLLAGVLFSSSAFAQHRGHHTDTVKKTTTTTTTSRGHHGHSSTTTTTTTVEHDVNHHAPHGHHVAYHSYDDCNHARTTIVYTTPDRYGRSYRRTHARPVHRHNQARVVVNVTPRHHGYHATHGNHVRPVKTTHRATSVRVSDSEHRHTTTTKRRASKKTKRAAKPTRSTSRRTRSARTASR